jgi:hypothetical protein
VTESPYPRLMELLEEIRVLAQEKVQEIERLRTQHENLSRECLGQYELMSAERERLLVEAADLRAEIARLVRK